MWKKTLLILLSGLALNAADVPNDDAEGRQTSGISVCPLAPMVAHAPEIPAPPPGYLFRATYRDLHDITAAADANAIPLPLGNIHKLPPLVMPALLNQS